MELGLFGKIPAKGDFVRHNVSHATSRAFEQWVQESNDSLRGAGGEMPGQAIRAVFTPPGSDTTVIAVIVPSEDKVGRRFPLVIFACTPVAGTREHFSAIPVIWSAFLDAAAALGERAKEMDLDALKSALSGLPTPSADSVEHGAELCRKTLAHPLAGELHGRLYKGDESMHCYAYQTFLTACQDASKSDPGKPATVLDCPVQVDVDLFLWLELTKRVFGFPPAHPQVLWIEAANPRLLLSLGSVSAQLLQFLAKPEMSHNRLWPLTTEREKAVETAKAALGETLGQLAAESTLEQLVDALTQRAASGTMR